MLTLTDGMMVWKPRAVATILLCEIITPFGVPVEPLVYMMIAVSSGDGVSPGNGAR